MEKFCFDQLKNIDVPESLIETALNISSMPEQKKSHLSIASIISIAAAAILMLLVGKTLFSGLFTPNLTTAPQTDQNSQKTTDSEGNAIIYTDTSTVSYEKPSDSSNYRGSFSESGETSATENRDTVTAETQAANNKNTEPEESSITEATSVPVTSHAQTQPQTEYYNEPCTETATGNTDNSTKALTDSSKPDGLFMGKLGFVYTNEDIKAPFKCSITSSKGEVFGGEMTLNSSNGITTVLYNPLEHGERLRSGNYTVCFYDSTGSLVQNVSFTAVSNSTATLLFAIR